VDVPREQAGSLDAERLRAEAGTVASLLAAMKNLGPARALYRIDQPVDLEKPLAVRLGAAVPIGQSAAAAGPKGRTGSYQDASCAVQLRGGWTGGAAGNGQFQLRQELSHIAGSGRTAADDHAALTLVNVNQEFGGVAVSGRPIVMLSISDDGTGDVARAYVTRLVLHTDLEKPST